MIYQLPNPIDVFVEEFGDCTAIMIIDYGIDVNTVWMVRLPGTGQIRHVLSDDIIMYGNPMTSSNGWDVKKRKGRWPKGAKINLDFKKNNK